jgi:hypothetical protein
VGNGEEGDRRDCACDEELGVSENGSIKGDDAAGDPVAASRRATVMVARWTGAVAVGMAVWALWPMQSMGPIGPMGPMGPETTEANRPSGSKPTTESSSSASSSKAAAPLNLAAFNAPLWVNPPVPAAAKPETPPPPPAMRAQLIAITHSTDPTNSGHRAIFYDEEKDALITVTVGDTIVGRRVVAVDAQSVTLAADQNGGTASRGTLDSAPGASSSASSNTTQRLELRPPRDTRSHGASASEDLAALMGRRLPSPRHGGTSSSPPSLPSSPVTVPSPTGSVVGP